MSFDRHQNYNYKSLPINNNNNNSTTPRLQKSVNFTMQQAAPPHTTHTSKVTIPINSLSSTSSTSVASKHNVGAPCGPGTALNTEEFAKLDALLEDLLAEVEQPILLNKHGENGTNKENLNGTRQFSGNNSDEIERSVDWLNEQKERLRSRKELISNCSSKHSASNLATKLSEQQTTGFTHFNKPNGYSKLVKSTPIFAYESNQAQFQCDNNNVYCGHEDPNGYVYLHQSKPPVSPTNRQLYSPSQLLNLQQQQQQQQSFRSISTNPALLRNINETDDEINMIEAEFDRYSQRSFRSNASTVQRSKYHTVSNDFVECTRPPAPTPLPITSTYTTKTSYRELNFCMVVNDMPSGDIQVSVSKKVYRYIRPFYFRYIDKMSMSKIFFIIWDFKVNSISFYY